MTGQERETIILFNEAEPDAEIFTYNKGLQSRMEKLAAEYPDLFKKSSEEQDGAKTYIFPKKYVAIRKPVQLSKVTLEKFAQNMRHIRQGVE